MSEIVNKDNLPMVVVAILDCGVRIACTTHQQLSDVFKAHPRCRLEFLTKEGDQ